MPKPQSWQGPKGMRPRKSRIDAARALRDRPPQGARKTGILWIIIGVVGIGVTIAGLFAWPLLVIGTVFVLVSFPLAIANFRKAEAQTADGG